MFKLLAAAVFGAVSVNAQTDMPVFSSNDDYDEINLNIRLLASHKSNMTGMKNATKFEGFTIKGSFQATVSAPDGTTAASMDADAATKTAMAAGVANATGVPKMAVKVTKISDASRRLSAARKLAVSLTLKVDYEMQLVNKQAVDMMVMYLAGDKFTGFLTAALTNELSALSADYGVSGIVSMGASVTSGPGVKEQGATTENCAAYCTDSCANIGNDCDCKGCPSTSGCSASAADYECAAATPTASSDGDDDDDDDDDESSASMIKMNAALIAGAAMVASLF